MAGILARRKAAIEAAEKERAAKEKALYDRLNAIMKEHAPVRTTEYRYAWPSVVNGEPIYTGRKFSTMDEAADWVADSDSRFLQENITWVESRVVTDWRQI